MPDGSFTETHDWISNESAARSAVNAIANQAGIASWFVDEYTAVGNALRALKTSVSLDLYNAWWEQYRESDLVPRDVVVPDGGWPIIEMDLFKIILRKAEEDRSRNIPLQKERAALMKKTAPASQLQKPAVDKQQPGTPQAIGKCRICQDDVGHNTKSCPNRSGIQCSNWARTGKCQHGNRCKFEHSGTAPKGANPAAKPAAAAVLAVPTPPTGAPPPYRAAPILQAAMPTAEPLQDFVPLSEVGTQDMVCRNRTAPDCHPDFSLDMTHWGKLINEKAKEGMEYHLPKSCDNCRAYDRTHHSASLMTSQDESPDAPFADIGNHENDGANDDYELYGNYLFGVMMIL